MESKGEHMLIRVMRFFITGIFFLLVFYLTLLAGFSTTAIHRSERSYLIQDSVWINLLAECLFVIGLYTAGKALLRLKRRKNPAGWISRFGHENVKRALYFTTSVLCVVFVLSVRLEPGSDQREVSLAAAAFLDGYYTPLEQGNYLFTYPNQAGIVLFLYYLGRLFGKQNAVVVQLLNVLAVFQIQRMSVSIAAFRKKSWARDLGILLAEMLFLPLTFYTTFVYGTLIGLALALTSFHYALCLIRDRKWRYAGISAVCMLLSIAVKQNFLIFGIAVILYTVYSMIREKFRADLLALLLALVAAVVFNGRIVDYGIYRITGQHLGKGMSSLSWVSMGINEGSPLYVGWWDRNVSTVKAFEESNYDKDLHAQASMARISERLARFREDPAYAVCFFAGKNASQWNNPDFEGWWLNVVRKEGAYPSWLERQFSVYTYNRTLFSFLNRYQFIILSGAVLYLLFCRRKNDAYVLFMIAFIGGFIFHTAWEAKGQYTFVYFLLLLPISVDGYAYVMSRAFRRASWERRQAVRPLAKLGALAVITAVVGLGNIPLLNSVFVRNDDTADYLKYLSASEYSVVPDGTYRIRPLLDPGLVLTAEQKPDNQQAASLRFAASEDGNSSAAVFMNGTKARIRFSGVEKCLDVPGGNGKAGAGIWAYDQNVSDAQLWTIRDRNEACECSFFSATTWRCAMIWKPANSF